MDERTRRLGENEALFRSVNEQVRDLNQTFLVDGTLRIVCECGDRSCIEQIELSPREYEAVRADSRQFAIKPGHEALDVETVVERNERYWVVRKDRGEAERLATETDPRRQ